MTSPTFSVVMAVHNGMPYLPVAMESIIGQTFRDFEMIVIDDHSTDGTIAYLGTIQDGRLRVVQSPGRGQTVALNCGIRNAVGEWVVRMDADDWSFPTRFALQRQRIVQSARAPVIVTSDYWICDEELRQIAPVRLAQPNPRIKEYLRRQNNPICHPTVVFHRAAALRVGLYDTAVRNAQDYLLWIRLLETGDWCHVSEALVKYRISRGSLSVLYQGEQASESKAIRASGSRRKPTSTCEVPARSTRAEADATYHYKLGFAAWLAGRRSLMTRHLGRALLAHRSYRLRSIVLMAMALSLPRRLYLTIAGYRGIFV